jgi:hypothetical protein
MSKTAKSKAGKKKSAKKSGAKKSKKELNPAEVRKDISRMVESEAANMAQAAIDEGKKGQLAPLRYLLEVANIFPGATDGSEATEDEDSLARTLLKRMGIPDVPIVREDEEEEPKAVSCADGVVAAGESSELGAEGKEKEPGVVTGV